MPALSEAIQPSVGSFRLRAGKWHSVKVPVASDHIEEVLGTWQDFFDTDVTTYNGKQLFVVPERSPIEQKRHKTMGRLKDFVEQEFEDSHTIQCYWAPDFYVFLERTFDSVLLAEVTENGGGFVEKGGFGVEGIGGI